MKNLKLISTNTVSSVCEGGNFCFDLDRNIYIGLNEGMHVLHHNAQETKFCGSFAREDQVQTTNIIEMKYLFQSHSIFIALSSGDLYQFNIYDDKIIGVGIVDSRIQACAWSSDEEFLVILTAANTLLLMTKDFDPIVEKSLCPEEFGEISPINVGWGSKTTQFHGSEGKEAAHIKQKEPLPALSYDDLQPRISWRDDGQYFATSSINPTKGFRQLRIWNQEAVLQSTCEILEGIEESIAWRPSGNLIACSQQCPNKHKVIFIEKNGLQHGEFTLPYKPMTYRVRNLAWNVDSKVLLITAETLQESPSIFEVTLWTCSNYHWYLKQKIDFKDVSPLSKWVSPYELSSYDPASGKLHSFRWVWCISQNFGDATYSEAEVLSIDNENILVTPFEKMVIPPPMCAYKLTMNSTIRSLFFSSHSSQFGAYLGDFKVALFRKELRLALMPEDEKDLPAIKLGAYGAETKIRHNLQPYCLEGFVKLIFAEQPPSEFALCHFTWCLKFHLLYVNYLRRNVSLMAVQLPSTFSQSRATYECQVKVVTDFECSVVGMCCNEKGNVIAVQLSNRKVLKIMADAIHDYKEGTLFCGVNPWLCDDGKDLVLPQLCPTMHILMIGEKNYFLGLSEKFDLFCNDTLILPKCTSFYANDFFLLATTIDNTLKSFSLTEDVQESITNCQPLSENVQCQKIEKGARIVTVPLNGPITDPKLILQMPRGNLETIHPRSLVVNVICSHLHDKEFGIAFRLAKRHRIDLNILFDHNPMAFLNNIEEVVNQIKSKEDLNLILASLKDEDVRFSTYPLLFRTSKEHNFSNCKVNTVCDAFRKVLEAKDDKLKKYYYHTILGTYAKKNPPELDIALLKLKDLKASSNDEATLHLVNSSLDFLLYLVDVNELLDVALGTYDLETTVMVAQKSQKDPKEFLPLYNSLLKLEENYRKFKIDHLLKRYSKALHHIAKCDDHFDECITLLKKHSSLFPEALHLFPPSSDHYKAIWNEYATLLVEKRWFDEAGLAFMRCGDYENALKAHIAQVDWQPALYTAAKLNYSDDQIVLLCRELAEKLKNASKFVDASHLLEHYVKDTEESIVTLIEGCEWNSATLAMSKYKREDIAETHLKPALVEHQKNLLSDLTQCFEDFNKHLSRLKYLRLQKMELPEHVDGKYTEYDMFSDIASVTDAASSCADSKANSGSIVTRKSSKSRRKQKLKKYKLKEGAPDEDLALVAALSEIIVKIDSHKDNFKDTLKALVLFEYDMLAKKLQQQMTTICTTIEEEIPKIWSPCNTALQSELKYGPNSTANSIAANIQQEQLNMSPVQRDPELTPPQWRKMDLFLYIFK